jgi:hypothetical protein
VTAEPAIKQVGDGRGDQVVADPEQSINMVEQVVTRADTADLSGGSILEQSTTVPSDDQEQGLIDDNVEDAELGRIEEEIQPNRDDVNASRRYDLRARKHIDYKTIERAAMHISVQQAIKQHGGAAESAIMGELQQMLDKKVFEPIAEHELTSNQLRSVIRSFMFLKLKYDSAGVFDKIKARLVAGGHQQDRTVYDDVSSPTAALTSVMMVAAIAAKEHRHVIAADIAGAYLNAEMKSANVLMQLDRMQSQLLVRIDPTYKQYVRSNGSIIVKLKKALYGCIQSALLWYQHISDTLVKYGFDKNPQDECVFNFITQLGKQLTVVVYVDDLLMTSEDMHALDDLVMHLRKVYKDITECRDSVLSYLGMQFDFSEMGRVRISMQGYVADLLSSLDVTGVVATPATLHLFDICDEEQQIGATEKERFHTVVAKLLYLAKRARPDILTAVAFLATRVQKPTVHDQGKLMRVLKYLNGTPALGIVLEPGAVVEPTAFVDASFAPHADGHSHSGSVITLGKGPIFVRSSKQRLVTKSSTEAELVAMSDEASQVLWSRDFLIGQGYKLGPTKLLQDNQSAIALIHKGKHASSRSRHVNIRYFFVKDRINSQELNVAYLNTNDMIADIMTKPLQGEQFRKMRAVLMNWRS